MKKSKLIIISILVVYLVTATLLWLYNDAIANWSITANPILVTLVNLFTSPFYLGSVVLFTEIFFRGFKINRSAINYARVVFAAMLLSLSLDIWTIPHSVTMNYQIPNTAQTALFFDTVMGKLLFPILGGLGKLGSFILYVGVSFILALMSLLVASPKHFLSLVKSEVGMNR